MAAAMRSALARLGRRACITAPPRTPPLQQAADRSVQGFQWYSSESSIMADKKNLEMLLSTCSKRSSEALKTIREADHYLYALTNFGLGIYALYVVATVGPNKT